MPSKDKVTEEAYDLLKSWVTMAVKKDGMPRRLILEMVKEVKVEM